MPTNSFLPKLDSWNWRNDTLTAIAELIRREEKEGTDAFKNLSERYKGLGYWHPKLLLQPAYRLGGKIVAIVLGLSYAALRYANAPFIPTSLDDFSKPETWYVIAIVAIAGLVIIALLGWPTLRDSRQDSHVKLQAKLQQVILEQQKNIHARVSVLVLDRLAAWENDFKLY